MQPEMSVLLRQTLLWVWCVDVGGDVGRSPVIWDPRVGATNRIKPPKAIQFSRGPFELCFEGWTAGTKEVSVWV